MLVECCSLKWPISVIFDRLALPFLPLPPLAALPLLWPSPLVTIIWLSRQMFELFAVWMTLPLWLLEFAVFAERLMSTWLTMWLPVAVATFPFADVTANGCCCCCCWWSELVEFAPFALPFPPPMALIEHDWLACKFVMPLRVIRRLLLDADVVTVVGITWNWTDELFVNAVTSLFALIECIDDTWFGISVNWSRPRRSTQREYNCKQLFQSSAIGTFRIISNGKSVTYTTANQHIRCGRWHMIVVTFDVTLFVWWRLCGADSTHRMWTWFSIGTSWVRTTTFQLLDECRLTCGTLFLHQLTDNCFNSFGRLMMCWHSELFLKIKWTKPNKVKITVISISLVASGSSSLKNIGFNWLTSSSFVHSFLSPQSAKLGVITAILLSSGYGTFK